VYFGVPSAVFSSSVLLLLPWVRRHGFGLYPTFVVTFLGPLALMLVAVLLAYGFEGRPWTWSAFADRLRLRWPARTWLWTVALVLVGFGLQAVIGLVAGRLRAVTFFDWPPELNGFMQQVERIDLGFELEGRWDVFLVLAGGLALFNIGGEELWWRGIILPRQELVFGAKTWLVNGALWGLFHTFYFTDLRVVVGHFGVTMPLAFAAQRSRSTWPGIVYHYLYGVGFPIGVLVKVLGYR
jgi:membrane protease YdiL (CAAX protease family)